MSRGITNTKCRKFPFTRRDEYELEDEHHELDGKIDSISDITKPPSPVINGFDTIEAGESSLHLSISSKLLLCCCGEQCWKTTESFNQKDFPHPFRSIDFLATCCSILFFFYDVTTDAFLAHKYFYMKRWVAFGFTAAFILFPLLVLNVQSLRWYHLDYKREKRGKGNTKCSVWFFRVIFTFPLMLGTVVRHIEYLYHGWKSRSVSSKDAERKYHYKQMLHEDTDAGMMRMLEAFLESAPQLVLQMYIMLTESPDDSMLMSIVRPVAMVGSWIGVSWSLVSYHKALRASHNEEESGLSICGTMFYYIWRACEVGPRIVVLALFASEFHYYFLIGLAGHWIAMFIWVTLLKPNFYERTCDKIAFNIVLGYVLIFCFQNVQDGTTRFRALLYYCVVYAENLSMLAAWLYFTSHKSDWYYLVAIIIVPSGMVLHISVQLLYYKCCHPRSDSIVCHSFSKKNGSKTDASANRYEYTFEV